MTTKQPDKYTFGEWDLSSVVINFKTFTLTGEKLELKQRASTLWSMEGCTTSIVNHPAKMTMPLPDVSTE